MKKNSLNISITFIAIVVLVIVLKTLKSFLIPFTIAIILTLLLQPLIKWSNKKKIPFFFIMICILLALFTIFGGIGYLLVNEVNTFSQNPLFTSEKISSVLDYVEEQISDLSFIGGEFNLEKIINFSKYGGIVASFITPIISVFGNFFSMLFTILIFLMFLIPSYPKFINDLKTIYGKKVVKMFDSIEKSVFDYLSVKSMISFGTAITSVIILLIFRSEYVIILGVLFFVLNFIPNVGSLIAVVIAVLGYMIQYGFTGPVILLLLLLVIVQLVFGNYIEPKFSGKKLSLSPIVILLSLFIWYYIWGIYGMLLAVPLTSIIKIILSNSGNKYSKLME